MISFTQNLTQHSQRITQQIVVIIACTLAIASCGGGGGGGSGAGGGDGVTVKEDVTVQFSEPSPYSAGVAFPITATFSPSVADTFSAEDLEVTNGTVSVSTYNAAAPTIYTIMVTPNGTGDITLKLKANSVTSGTQTNTVSPTLTVPPAPTGTPNNTSTSDGAPTCLALGDVENGQITYSTDDLPGYALNTEATYKCNDRFILDFRATGAAEMRTCEYDNNGDAQGIFSNAAPMCIVDPSAPMQVGEVVITDGTNSIVEYNGSEEFFRFAVTFDQPITKTSELVTSNNGMLENDTATATDDTFSIDMLLSAVTDKTADIKVTMHAGVVENADGVGNAEIKFTLPYFMDTSIPTVSFNTSVAAHNGTRDIDMDVIFSEAVTGLTADGFTLEGATFSGLDDSGTGTVGTVYTLTVTPTLPAQDITVTVNAGAATDGTNGNVTNSVMIPADTTIPTVSFLAPTTYRGRNANAFTIELKFSEEVTGLTEEGFTHPNATIELSGTGADYTLQVIPTDRAQDITVTVKEGAATDGANGNVANSVTIRADTEPPTVTLTVHPHSPNTMQSPPSFSALTPFTVILEFSEDVFFDHSSRLTIDPPAMLETTNNRNIFHVKVTPREIADHTLTVPMGSATDGFNLTDGFLNGNVANSITIAWAGDARDAIFELEVDESLVYLGRTITREENKYLTNYPDGGHALIYDIGGKRYDLVYYNGTDLSDQYFNVVFGDQHTATYYWVQAWRASDCGVGSCGGVEYTDVIPYLQTYLIDFTPELYLTDLTE